MDEPKRNMYEVVVLVPKQQYFMAYDMRDAEFRGHQICVQFDATTPSLIMRGAVITPRVLGIVRVEEGKEPENAKRTVTTDD